MPLTRVEIEETGPNRFVAEVEQGGYASARRTNVRGGSRGEIIARVAEQLGCADEVILCLHGIVRERTGQVEAPKDPAPVQASDPPLANEGGPQGEDNAKEPVPATQADTSGTVEAGPGPTTTAPTEAKPEDSAKTPPPGGRVGKGGVVYERIQKAT